MFIIEKKEYMTEDTKSRGPKIIGVMLEWDRSLPMMTRVQYILKIESNKRDRSLLYCFLENMESIMYQSVDQLGPVCFGVVLLAHNFRKKNL